MAHPAVPLGPTLRPDFERPGVALYRAQSAMPVLDLGDADAASIAAALDAVDRLVIGRRTPYVVITDTRRITSIPGADVRRAVADWMKKNEKGHTSLGAVTIISSGVVRGAMTALNWLFTPPNPQGVTASYVEAHRWAASQFEAAGKPLPPSLLDPTPPHPCAG